MKVDWRWAGLVAAILVALKVGWAREADGPQVWVADRDGDSVVRLDHRLIECGRWRLESPVAIEADGHGGAWVLTASEGTPLGGHQLVSVRDGRAPVGWGGAVRGPRAIAVDGRGDAWVLAAAGGECEPERADRAVELWWGARPPAVSARAGSDLSTSEPLELRRIGRGSSSGRPVVAVGRALATQGDRIAVGSDGGTVVLGVIDRSRAGREPRVAWLARVNVEGSVRGLAPTGSGGWWVRTAGPDRLLAVDADRVLRAEVGVAPASGCSPLPLNGGAWLAGREGRSLIGVDGVGSWPSELDLPAEGVDPVDSVGADVILVSLGALLQIDRRGRPIRAQGGFVGAVDAAVVEAGRASWR